VCFAGQGAEVGCGWKGKELIAAGFRAFSWDVKSYLGNIQGTFSEHSVNIQ
jgi:hypothetical protein